MPQLPFRASALQWPPTPEQWSELNEMVGDIYHHLGASGVAAGDYGSAGRVPSVTVDARGRITNVSQTRAAGTYILLEERTASGDSALSFTTRNMNDYDGATFQSDFDEYVIRILGLTPDTNNVDFRLHWSIDGGSSYDTSSIYDDNYHWASPPGGSGNYGGSTNVGGITFAGNTSDTSTAGVYGDLTLFNPGDLTHHKIMHGLISFDHDTLGFIGWRRSFRYRSVQAVNAFQVSVSSGAFDGVVRVYGITP